MSDFESFETQMQELEQIVQQMENRSLNLAESMKAHKRGMKLAKECEKILKLLESKKHSDHLTLIKG